MVLLTRVDLVIVDSKKVGIALLIRAGTGDNIEFMMLLLTRDGTTNDMKLMIVTLAKKENDKGDSSHR